MPLFLMVTNAPGQRANWKPIDRPEVPFHGKTTTDQLWWAGYSREYLEAVIAQKLQDKNPAPVPVMTWTIEEVQEIPLGYR